MRVTMKKLFMLSFFVFGISTNVFAKHPACKDVCHSTDQCTTSPPACKCSAGSAVIHCKTNYSNKACSTKEPSVMYEDPC